MFDLIIHADWSVRSAKCWAVVARKHDAHWLVSDAEPAWPADKLIQAAKHKRVLAGFDFPIGVPGHWAKKAGIEDFKSILPLFGSGEWAKFFDVAKQPAEISTYRPFYPNASLAGTKRTHLMSAHGASSFDQLRRLCERHTDNRGAACALFWTLGGNQVGKAAIAGWQKVIVPAVRQGARLWPFDGDLADHGAGGLTIAETYPAEAYKHIGVRFRAGMSKRRQSDRATFATVVEAWSLKHDVELSLELLASLRNGFGTKPDGEDRFDALLGLCGMIEVVDGRRQQGAPNVPQVRRIEGWIFGQSA